LNAYVPEEVISILYHDYKARCARAANATNKAAGAVTCATAAATSAIIATSTACTTVAGRACAPATTTAGQVHWPD
jgi:hypothetical protein